VRRVCRTFAANSGEIFEDGLRQQGGNNGFGIFGATDVFPELTINLVLNVRKRF
jgi:hypothetical protein